MRIVLVPLLLSLSPLVLSGTLEGTVTGYDGALIDNAPVRVTNESTQEEWRAFSAADGSYQIHDVPEGSYTVSIEQPCCTYSTFRQDGLAVGSEDRVFDPVLPISTQLGTFGEAGVWDMMRERRGELPDLPVPRIGDHPDLSGFYLMIPDGFPEAPQPTAWAAEIQAERASNHFADAPGMRCLPQQLIGPLGLGRFVQKEDRLVILFEGAPYWRQIYLDGRQLPEDPNPTWLGHSVGRWEGDTLVVETIGYNGRAWNSGFPVTEDLKMTEYLERTGYGEIAYRAVYDDPDVFQSPWTQRTTLELAPDEDVMETVCENNRW